MDELIAFVRARLDQDEKAARAATEGPWRYSPLKHYRAEGASQSQEAVFAGPSAFGGVCVASTGGRSDPQSMANADHITRHDPARVLRQSEAIRRIVTWHAITMQTISKGHADREDYARRDDLRRLLRVFAAIWDDHPDYRYEWAP